MSPWAVAQLMGCFISCSTYFWFLAAHAARNITKAVKLIFFIFPSPFGFNDFSV
jgi:hypothetical protein